MKRSDWMMGLLHCEDLIKTFGHTCQKGDFLLAFYQDYTDHSSGFQNGFLDCIKHYESIGVIA